MKRFLVATALLLTTLPVQAIDRFDIGNMNCAAVQEAVKNAGEAILRYQSTSGSGVTMSDRYVADNSQCKAGECTAFAAVPTADNAECPVLVCKPLDGQEQKSGCDQQVDQAQ